MRRVLYEFLSKFYLSGCSHYNPLSVRRACRSKAQSRAAFKNNAMPYAQGTTFISPLVAFKFAQKYGFPLVVKPNVGGFSRGVYAPIENNWQLLKASIFVKKWWPISIVERYLHGKNYRIVMTKFGIMSILRRYPPFVIGDGKHNIATLIRGENNTRKQMDLYPMMRPIVKNKLIKKHLKIQNLTFNSIVGKGVRVYLQHAIALKAGGVIEVLRSNALSPKNQMQIKQILTFFDANILGIDVICTQDLATDFAAQKCIFLELNSRPLLKMAESPRLGKKVDLSAFYQRLDKIKIDDKFIF